MVEVADVLDTQIGHVVAPAGCGKTELIANCISAPHVKPPLVLTHTTAGVAALRHRLNRAGIAPKTYRLNTIAGWAINLISMFPERSGFEHNPLDTPNYSQIQFAIGRLCESGDIQAELKATYERVYVDEYQDCSVSQHAIVSGLSKALPTIVFGDPMQAIFGFGNDPLPSWDDQVVNLFPEVGKLEVPWRWNNANTHDLGRWLLEVREALSAGQSIDLRTCPNRVFWYQLSGDQNENISAQIRVQYEISKQNPEDTLLIIGDSMQVATRHTYASRARGVSVVEPVDFKDVIRFATQMDGQTGQALLLSCLSFLTQVMTNVQGDQMQRRIQSIMAGRNQNPATPQEIAAINLFQNGSFIEAVSFLESMSSDRNRRIYRHSAFNIMFEALKTTAFNSNCDLNSSIAQLREKRRHAGRKIPYKAVGSTLLLKGLEADHILILDADRPASPMTKEHLYVALTRGAKSIHIFSRNCILP